MLWRPYWISSSIGNLPMSAEREAESASGKQNGENFNDEMKDYAKSTMNELLGMFGYEEAITREAVEELQIRLLPDDDDEQDNNGALEKLTETAETEGDEPVAVTLDPNEAPVVVQIPGGENGGNPSVVPMPEMNTEVIPLSKVSQATPELSSLPSGANDNAKTGTALSKITSDKAPTSSDLPRPQEDEGVQVTYTSSPSTKPAQKFGQCKWCKKSNVLQNFSSSDGEKEISCKDLCSALCFEQAVKGIKENHSRTNNTQQVSPINKSAKNSGSSPKKIPPALGFVLFSWDDYLAKTNSEAALWSYFRQAQVPPYNGFQRKMKLEVADPRIVDTMCVATVVGILGPRIRCRFDGTDSANDVWHLVDSKEIHPVGWCEGNGGRLQPPVGFHLDPGKYSTFLAKTLASAELAPVRLFKREPTAPKENMFKVGMKLEALDPKNPLLICVATVADVDGDRIRVDFDGYLGSDYWCRYDSRDIFPVGWCYLSGHPLQPPGKTKKALKISAKTNSAPEKSVKPEKAAKLEKPVKPVKPEKPEKRDKKKIKVTSSITPASVETSPVPTPVVTTPSSTRPGCDSPSSSGIDPEDGVNHTVQVFINHACEAGPHLSVAKVAGLPTCFRGTVLNVTRDCIQSVVNAAIEPSVVFGFLRSGTGRIKISAKDGKQTLSCYLQVIDRVAVFWRVLEKFADNLQCCENLLCGERITGPCPKCGKSASRRNTVLPETPSLTAKKSTVGLLKRNALSEPEQRQQLSAKHPRITIDDEDASQSPQVCSTSPPKTWSVSEVVKFIENSELAEHAEMFRKHEIDGKALLLLTREMIMSYMGLKLGPAIKLLCFIEELKNKKYT